MITIDVVAYRVAEKLEAITVLTEATPLTVTIGSDVAGSIKDIYAIAEKKLCGAIPNTRVVVTYRGVILYNGKGTGAVFDVQQASGKRQRVLVYQQGYIHKSWQARDDLKIYSLLIRQSLGDVTYLSIPVGVDEVPAVTDYDGISLRIMIMVTKFGYFPYSDDLLANAGCLFTACPEALWFIDICQDVIRPVKRCKVVLVCSEGKEKQVSLLCVSRKDLEEQVDDLMESDAEVQMAVFRGEILCYRSTYSILRPANSTWLVKYSAGGHRHSMAVTVDNSITVDNMLIADTKSPHGFDVLMRAAVAQSCLGAHVTEVAVDSVDLIAGFSVDYDVFGPFLVQN